MAKMYLFRKLSELHQQQSDVCEEAVSSVLDDVLSGRVSTIFNYGNWPTLTAAERLGLKGDMIKRILCDLFSHVYSLEVTMEINISITHVQLYLLQHHLFGHADERQCPQDHFVATPQDVYAYMERVIGQLQKQTKTRKDYSYALFSICVSQTNLDQSVQLHGCLQLVLLHTLDRSEVMAQPDTPMTSLLRIFSALANNRKSHLRYYNIRLSRTLKELMGREEGTVIINYTMEPVKRLDSLTAVGCAKIWKALYLRERNKANYFSDKLLSLEFWTCSGHKFHMDELLELLRTDNAGIQLELQLHKRRSALAENHPSRAHLEQTENVSSCSDAQLLKKLEDMKLDAAASIEEVLRVHKILSQLSIGSEEQTLQLQHKDLKLARLQLLLADTKEKLHQQRVLFQRKLTSYSEMFRSLWTQQRQALQAQEVERELQLTEMFDAIYDELHSTQLTQPLEGSEP